MRDIAVRMSEIVRIDARGRVVMPSSIRDALGLREGMYVMLVADLERKDIRIVPFADPEAKLVELQITLRDAPGSLARVAAVLANNRVDLLSTESRTLKRGESAEWHAIADVSKCECKLDELRSRIKREGAAIEANFQNF